MKLKVVKEEGDLLVARKVWLEKKRSYLIIDFTNDECPQRNNSNFAIKLSAVHQSLQAFPPSEEDLLNAYSHEPGLV